MDLDHERCYRAVASRDARFDGAFYTAVRTTGIYCRPSCPAVTPKRRNVTFYRTPAAAQGEGFRACRRCRPDAAPGSAEWNVRGDVVARLMRLVADGSGRAPGRGRSRHDARLQRAPPEPSGHRGARRRDPGDRPDPARALRADPPGDHGTAAQRGRMGGRLRQHQVLQRHDRDGLRGVAHRTEGPAQGCRQGRTRRGAARRAQSRGHAPRSRPARRGRTARRRSQHGEGERQAGQPGGAAGDRTGRPRPDRRPTADPAAVRRRRGPGLPGHPRGPWDRGLGRCELPARPRAAERTCDRRVLGGRRGRCSSREFRLADLRDLAPAVARVRRLFDLDADPQAVADVLGADPLLARRVAARPGLRMPGSVDPHEMVVRAVVGQQVSVAGALTLVGRLVAAHGRPLALDDPQLTRVFPTAGTIAELDPAALAMPRARGAALVGVCRALADGSLVVDAGRRPGSDHDRAPGLRRDRTVDGGLRGDARPGDPDVMLAGDLGVRRAIAALGGDDRPRAIEQRAHALATLALVRRRTPVGQPRPVRHGADPRTTTQSTGAES